MNTDHTPAITQELLETLRAMKRELGDSSDPVIRRLMDEAGELIEEADAERDGGSDWTNDPQYQAFVEEMAAHCHCWPLSHRPCDGVLAGGLCDEMDWTEDRDTEED